MTELPDGTWAVILAGGAGTRFWPASTPERPKQLLALGGERPLFVETWERARALVGPDRVRVVARAKLLEAFREVTSDLTTEACLTEPTPRGTAPALAWAAHHVLQHDPAAAMVAMHADHVIEPLHAFQETVARAIRAARDDARLYCIGLRPDRPETGYGYVRLGGQKAPGIFRAAEFVEKPDVATARDYVASGQYLWNTGIFVWRAADFLDAVRRLTPELSEALPALEAGDVDGFFRNADPVSVDVGVMERAERVGVVEASFQWDDVGVWNALARTRPSDGAGNVAVGEARMVDARDNIAWSEEGRVTLFGVDGLVVVRAGGEVLVTSLERAPRLKELLARLERAAGGRGEEEGEEEGELA